MLRFSHSLLCVLLIFSSAAALAQVSRLERERMHFILNVVSKDVEKHFYDPNLRGLDWKALTQQAHQRIDQATTNGAMVTAIYSLVDKLQDSHTVFLAPSRATRPLFGFEAKAFGDDIRIYDLNPKGAAAAAGVREGDRILQINGHTAEPNSFNLMMLYYRLLNPAPQMQVVYQRGTDPPQTTIIQPKVKKEPIVRDLTNDLDLWALIREYEGNLEYHVVEHDGVGYMEVPAFEGESLPMPHQFQALKAAVIDLRGNLGGSQDSLAELAGHFVDSTANLADVVTRKKTEPISIKPQKPRFVVPMVVLVDSSSASAAEMFARYFQLSGRAVVIGDQTSGRVNSARFFSEQIGTDTVVPFGVEVSVGHVLFPGGEELEKHGVKPDVVCLPASDDLREHRDP